MTESQLMYRHRYAIRLEEPLKMRTLPGFVNGTEAEAHRFEVTVTLDDLPCVPENAVGYAIRPDGVRVMRPGTVEDGAVCWILPQEAMALPGMVQVMINAGRGDTVTTVLLCTLTVSGGTSGPMTDAADVVPTLNKLLQKIGDCEDAAAEATEATAQANDAIAFANALSDRLIPRFSAAGQSVSCHPLPDSAITVTAPEGATLLACGSVPCVITDYVGATTYYYITGGNTGLDVPLPPGDWIVSFRVHTQSGISQEKPLDLFIRRPGQSPRIVTCTAAEGSVAIHLDAADAVSVWMISYNAGFTAMGYPKVDLMIAAAPMPEGELPAGDTTSVTGNTVTAKNGITHIWSTDGSTFTAEGKRDPVWLLNKLCEKEEWL